MPPSRRRSGGVAARVVTARVVVALVLALAFAACSGDGPAPTASDSIAPVMVRGKVVDSTGTPISTKYLQVSIFDTANSQVGQPVPMVYDAQYVVGIDGTFEARVPITPEITRYAAANGAANFMLMAVGTDGTIITFGFPREIKLGQWAGEVPFVTLRPDGGSEINEHPSQP